SALALPSALVHDIEGPQEAKPVEEEATKPLKLEDITLATARAYYAGEEVFGEPERFLERKFRDERNQFIEAATLLTGSVTEARRLAWAQELRYRFPTAPRDQLMKLVDVSDQKTTLETMKDKLVLVQKGKHPLLLGLGDKIKTLQGQVSKAACQEELSYFELLQLTDKYIRLVGVSSGNENDSDYTKEAFKNAEIRFGHILFIPSFEHWSPRRVSDLWVVGLHPIGLVDPFLLIDYDGGTGNGRDFAKHDFLHSIGWESGGLKAQIRFANMRIKFKKAIQKFSPGEQALLEIMWFHCNHEQPKGRESKEGMLSLMGELISGLSTVVRHQSLENTMPLLNDSFKAKSFVKNLLNSKFYRSSLAEANLDEMTGADLLKVMEDFRNIVEGEL
ncbi:MAG: hypothetical protein KDK66_09125, partial [Deltaproteobacteria bacterium]|nr:hypothetical protein [Deltaproteobacteria bacterium]